jgi:hypothetical protein
MVLSLIVVCCSDSGMHKKSIEAAHKLTEDDGPEPKKESSPSKGTEVLRSESIATLRAKAQEHSAKVMEALGGASGSGHCPPNNNNAKTFVSCASSAASLNSSVEHTTLSATCSLSLDLDCFGDPS